MEDLIRTEMRADGVLVGFIDMPDRTMNVFSPALMDALDSLLGRVEQASDIRGVVITSSKTSFLAGADLAMVRSFTERALTDSHAQMFALCGRLGRLFLKLENCAKPWVAAVNGTALGGGLELAMACRARIAADDGRALIGLPEVKLGLLPGAGGTQRLPRLIGLQRGLDLLLSGRSVDPARGATLGIFDRVVPGMSLLNEACALAARLQGVPYEAARKFRYLDDVVPADNDSNVVSLARENGIEGEDIDHYPAHRAIIRSVLQGAGKSMREATDIEMTRFLDLMFDPVAGNMVRTLFLNRQRAEKSLPVPGNFDIRAIRTGELADGDGDWRATLDASRVPLVVERTLAADSIEIVDSTGARHVAEIRGTASANGPAEPGKVRAVLSANSRHGRVLEIVGIDAPEGCVRAVARLARRIGALAYRTTGPHSVLQRLAAAGGNGEGRLDALVQIAARAWKEGLVDDPAMLDVAAVVGGLAPAYTGGPMTYAWQHRDAMAVRLEANIGRPAWQALEARLGAACGPLSN